MAAAASDRSCSASTTNAAGCEPGRLGQVFLASARQENLWCSQHPGAVPGEAGRAPLAGGGERHGRLPGPASGRREGLPDGGQRRVLVLVTGECAEGRFGWGVLVEPDGGLERDAAVGEGAGLVEADRSEERRVG